MTVDLNPRLAELLAPVTVDAYEQVNWPPIRAAWIASWSADRCMACGRRRPLTVHHLRYRKAWIGGRWQPARGAAERTYDLIELCVHCHLGKAEDKCWRCRRQRRLRTGERCRPCRRHLLRGHKRYTPNLADLTRRHVRRIRRRNWWRRPPTPAWIWSRT